MAKTGRPTKYNKELAISICSMIGMGNSLTKVCGMKEMPSVQSVYTWFKLYPEFLEDYTRAKTDSGDADADRINDIAEKVLTGELEPQAARVAIDAYKWSAGKKRPKKYGDKQFIDVTERTKLEDSTDEELEAQLKELRKREAIRNKE